jgi:hypothetical protein
MISRWDRSAANNVVCRRHGALAEPVVAIMVQRISLWKVMTLARQIVFRSLTTALLLFDMRLILHIIERLLSTSIYHSAFFLTRWQVGTLHPNEAEKIKVCRHSALTRDTSRFYVVQREHVNRLCRGTIPDMTVSRFATTCDHHACDRVPTTANLLPFHLSIFGVLQSSPTMITFRHFGHVPCELAHGARQSWWNKW